MNLSYLLVLNISDNKLFFGNFMLNISDQLFSELGSLLV